MLVTERERLREELIGLAEKHGRQRSSLMAILQEVQRRHARISEYAMQVIADLLDIHPVEVYSVVSFYSFLGEQPQGQFVIRLCRTITCDMAGKSQIARQLENDLGIRFGETTSDGKFSLHWANCLGMCDQGPAMLVNDQIYTRRDAGEGPRHFGACRQSFPGRSVAGGGRIRMTSPTRTGALTFSDIRRAAAWTAALAKRPRRGVDADRPLRAAGPRRGRLPHQPEMEHGRRGRRPKTSTSSATPTRASPARSRTASSSADFADLVFEGMTIGARVIGARHGIIYLRAEYTYLRPHLEAVLQRRREENLLGKNIRGGRGVRLRHRHPHGRRGLRLRRGDGPDRVARRAPRRAPQPPALPHRHRLPGPSDDRQQRRDLRLGDVHPRQGPDWFKGSAPSKSTGRKLFSVSGDCARPGVYEFPMGITVAELLEEVGGEGAKAVQIGGASGQCVPAAQFDRDHRLRGHHPRAGR